MISNTVHPLTDPELYAQAERAARNAFDAANLSNASPYLRMRQMDKAAYRVFIAAGVRRDVADFFAYAIGADILCLAHLAKRDVQS